MAAPSDTSAAGVLQTAIARPVTVVVGVILIIMFGLLSVTGLPIQVTPDVSIPTITVSTTWPGAAPTEIETEILEPQEDALKSLEGLVKMESTAQPDRGSVSLELGVGTEIEDALVRVTNRLSQVPAYPEAANEPVVTTASSTGPPLAVLTITSPEGAPVAQYRSWVEERIVPQLERIPGVAEARLIGGRTSEIHVDFDMAELAVRRLTVPEVAARIRGELRDVSGGDLNLGKRRYILRTPVAPLEPRELESLVLGADEDGSPILLGHVATVRTGLRDVSSVAFSDDRPSMVFLLSREAGTNVLEVTQRIRRRAQELQESMFAPEGLELMVVSDQTKYITGALELVEQNLLLGAFFAMVVLLLFLRSFGSSAIVSLAIPVCVFGTALGMSLFGRTVNVVSLAGITFAVGMVLDNSIVALESIDTWRTKVATAAEAALAGIREVWGAILASTLTTAAVFIPIITWEGEVGQLLRDVAVAVSVAVGFSLVVSVLVIPSLAGWALRSRRSSPDGAEASRRPRPLVRLGQRVRDAITNQTAWLTRSRLRAAAVPLVILGLALAAGLTLLPPLEYLPAGNRNLVFGIIVPPPGYSPFELEAIGKQVQGTMAAHTGKEKDGVPALERSFFVGSPEGVFSGAIAEDPGRVKEMLAFLRQVQSSIPGVFAFTTQASLFGRNLGGGRSIEIELGGSDLVTLTGLGGRMMGMLREVLPDAQVRPIPSLDPGAPELRAVPRREEIAALGMSASDIGLVVDSLVDGAIIGELGPEGKPKRNVLLRALNRSGQEVRDVATLASAPVATPSGHVVPLATLADVREELGPTQIRRVERNRTVTLQVSPHEDMPLEEGILRVREDVIGKLQASGTVPAGVELRLSGAASKLDEATERFGQVLLMAVVILFLLMAAVFEDFIAPLAVLVTVPLAAAGGVIGLRLVDALLGPQPLDLMTAVGFLILIGVVVNNAILVVDGSIARIREGLSIEDSVSAAVRARVRPIFMTTATSLAGLTPMVVFEGSGSELYRGVGAIVLGGLALGTVLTLYVVPSVFVLLWTARRAVRRALRGASQSAEEEPSPS